MFRWPLAVASVLLGALLQADAELQSVTPVAKVITLLTKLQEETVEEGKAEAAAYDGFACFCKAQADEKVANIKKADAAVERLEALIAKLDGEITDLSADAQDSNERIAEIEKECADAQKKRDKEAQEFSQDLMDASAAVSECQEALDQLMASKTPGGASLLQLPQLREAVSKSLRRAIDSGALRVAPEQVPAIASLLDMSAGVASAPGFKFHSGVVIDTIRETLKTFKKDKAELQMDGAEKKHTFDMAQSARMASKQSMKEQLAQVEEIIAAKEDEKQSSEDLKEKTSNDKQADKKFLEALTTECQNKASDWDKRSKTRSNELQALSQALAILKGKVADNYGANKKLNLLDRRAGGELSFLQLSGVESRQQRKVIQYLSRQARRVHSQALETLVVRLKADHFKKVRDIIKDLVAKLEADAENEATQKAWCDEEMGKATKDRDDQTGNVERDLAKVTKAGSLVKELTTEIGEVEVQLAELNQALVDATELRDAEKAENTKTIADSKAGFKAVKAATKALKHFYDNALVQTARYTPPNSDAEGNTVGDLAPKTFEGEYKGNQAASKGILGLMAVITSDFEGTIEATEDAEKDAAAEYEEFKNGSNREIDEKKDVLKDKKRALKDAEAEVVEFKDDLKEHSSLKKEALDELAKLIPSCVSTGATYEEKVARREQEIESLKTAYKIFDEMQ